MSWRNLLFTLFFGFAVILSAFAANDLYRFQTAQQEAQFKHLISELRCLVCQNENLADSNAGLAKDLRELIYQMTLAGQNETQIKNYLISRYTDFILFKPPLKGSTLLLWFSPFAVLILGMGYIIKRSLKSKKNTEIYLAQTEE